MSDELPYNANELEDSPIPIDELRFHPLTKKLSTLRRVKPIYYSVITLDLGDARTDTEIEIVGDFIMVQSIGGSLSARLNEKNNDSLDFAVLKSITTPVYRIFFTNTAQVGLSAVIIIGRDELFTAER